MDNSGRVCGDNSEFWRAKPRLKWNLLAADFAIEIFKYPFARSSHRILAEPRSLRFFRWAKRRLRLETYSS